MAGEKKYIALEATSQEIRGICGNTYIRIGETPNETGGSATEGTVFAKLNKLIEQLTALATNIGTNTSEETVNEKLNQILNSMSTQTGVIRHIQRGKVVDSDKTGFKTVALEGFTNLDKMFVLVSGWIWHGNTTGYKTPCVTIASTTELRVETANTSNYEAHVEYQVIETY